MNVLKIHRIGQSAGKATTYTYIYIKHLYIIQSERINLETKKCTRCGETKELKDFTFAKSNTGSHNFRKRYDGYRSQCKKCKAELAREYRYAHPELLEKYRENRRNKVKESPEMKKLKSAIGTRRMEAKARHKRKHDTEVITKEELMVLWEKQKGICALSGVPMSLEPKTKNTLSLDQIEAGKGYVLGNCQWVTWSSNRAKGDMSTDDFIDMCRKVVANFNDYRKPPSESE